MFTIHSRYRTLVERIIISCFLFCLLENSFGQAASVPMPVIQAAVRVPLIPSVNRQDSRNFVYPTVLRNNSSLALFTSRRFDLIEIVNANGVLVFQENIGGRTGRFDINFKSLTPPGIYYVRLRDRENMIIQKVAVMQ